MTTATLSIEPCHQWTRTLGLGPTMNIVRSPNHAMQERLNREAVDFLMAHFTPEDIALLTDEEKVECLVDLNF